MAVLTDEELFAMIEADDDTPPAPFVVDDEKTAAWVVDKLLQMDEREARIKEQAAAMLADVQRDRGRFERHFLGQLEAWFDQAPKRGKSIKLLTGTLAKRTVPGGVSIVDAKVTLAWAQQHLPAAVGSVPKLDNDAVRAHVEKTGELAPGVEIRPERESFSIKGPTKAGKDA